MSPIDFVMSADIYRDDFIVFDNELHRHAIADIDGGGVQTRQAAFQSLQAQGRMMWI